MKVEAEQKAIKTRDTLVSINYDLIVRACEAGEEQLQRGENFICNSCPEGKYLLVAP